MVYITLHMLDLLVRDHGRVFLVRVLGSVVTPKEERLSLLIIGQTRVNETKQ